MLVHLARFAHTPFGTFGKLFFEDDATYLYTLEPKWADNWPRESCIPPALGADPTTYPLVPDMAGKYQHYRVEGVPGRTAIEFHPGNTHYDTDGCILVGTALGSLGNRWAVLNSMSAAIPKLHEKLGLEPHTLKVSWTWL